MIKEKIGGVIFGTLFIAIGVYLLYEYETTKRTGTHTKGIVVDFEQSGSGSSSTYYPIFKFTDKTDTISSKGSVGSSPKAHSIGDTVQIAYLVTENNNYEIVVVDRWRGVFGRSIFILVGIYAIFHSLYLTKSRHNFESPLLKN